MRIDTYIYKTIYCTIMLKFDNENESKMNNKEGKTEISISFDIWIMIFYDMFEDYVNT